MQAQEEYGLFLFNNKATNPLLSIRKLASQDLVYKVYKSAVDSYRQKDLNDKKFILVFTLVSDIENFLK